MIAYLIDSSAAWRILREPATRGRWGGAAHHGLTVLHDDNDFETAARHLAQVSTLRVSA